MGEDSDSIAQLYPTWCTPADALSRLPQSWDYKTKVRWIAERLTGGLIRAASPAHLLKTQNEATREFRFILPIYWKDWACLADSDFWAAGDVTFYNAIRMGFGVVTTGTFYSVRLDPAPFAEFDGGGEPPAKPAAQVPKADERKPPASAELKRFCRAVLSEWPDASEDWLREKAVLFFPDNRIRRDPFREILREIRGPVKRGKKPNS